MLTLSSLQTFPAEIKDTFVSMHNCIVMQQEEITRLRRQLFGAKSERHLPLEYIEPVGSLFNEAEALAVQPEPAAPEPESVPPKKRGGTENSGGRKAFPENLPRERVVHDVPVEGKSCPNDGAELEQVGEVIVERLEIVPAQLKVVEHVYPKYGCPVCEQHVATAPAIPTALPKVGCEPSLLAYILVQKYLFAMPLYRLEAQFAQLGYEVSRVSMARWVIGCADFLEPLIYKIKEFILAHEVVHADETTLQVLKGTGKSPTSKSYMWALCTSEHDPTAVYYEYHSGRDGAAASELLHGFKGTLQADGYDGYNEIIKQQNLIRAGCWSHVRRKFDVAKKDGAAGGKGLSSQFLELIQELFLLERNWKGLNEEQTRVERGKESLPVIAKIKELLDTSVDKVPPKSKLGEAMRYMRNEWEFLTAFLKNGKISLSNNRLENFIRPFAVGRKNWLFANTVEGAKASAHIYSLVVTAKAHNLDVHAYITALLSEIPAAMVNQTEPLDFTPYLPWNWKKTLRN